MKIVVFLLGMCCLSVVNATDTYIFGIVPQQSAKVLAQKWTPLLRYLEQETGYRIKFATTKNIPTFEARLAKGEYDMAYMNPYHFILYHQESGYQALAKQKDKKVRGILVVHKNSEITSIRDLNGLELAFPSPAAFAASIIPRVTLHNSGINIGARYVSSHDSVYMNVAKGFFPAGGGVIRTFESVSPLIRDELKVIWTSEGFTSHAVARKADLDKAVYQSVLTALLALNSAEDKQTILKAINFKGFEAADNSLWNDIRALDIASMSIHKALEN